MSTRFFKSGHRPDYAILSTIFILLVFGLVMLASASSELGEGRFGDSYYYLKHQLLYGLLPGLFGFLVASRLYYRHYQKLALVLLLINVVALLLVFTNLGYTAGGAGRWLKIGPVTFQPSEFLKLTFIIYLAAWLSNARASRAKIFFEGFLPFLIICGLIAGILIRQPATSTVVILLSVGALMYFLSGARLKYLALLFMLGVAALGLVILFTPYRLERVKTFLSSDKESALGTGYHLNEALTTIGSGGLWGVGFGKSTVKSGRLPAAINDSIFAIIASELGFVGAGMLIALFGFLSFRILWLARNLRDNFGKLLLVGFGGIIAIQAFVNIASMSNITPLTGIPLPFISYGGTALAVFLTMSGIMVNVSRYA